MSRPIIVSSGVPQGSHLGPFIFNVVTDDSSSVLKYCKSLKYADDLKLYYNIRSNEDCLRMQSDIFEFVLWSKMNGLSLNVDKCFAKSYYRRRNPIIFDYKILNRILVRPDIVEDLGVIFDTKVTFNPHIDAKLAKASSRLGFVMRCAREFDDIYIFKTLYCAIVRPIIEHASVVWSPHYTVHVDRIESLQRRFLLRALHSLGWSSFILPPYVNRLLLIDLPTLESRRELASVCFVFDLLTGRLDAPELLAQVPIHAPARQLRTSDFLRLNTHRTVYGTFSPLERMYRLFNEVNHLFEFNISKNAFKSAICRSSH
jgi:hypothetical protein